MDTVKNKAEHWLNDNVAGWDLKHLGCLKILLKEQDRDTRHACAEAVISIESEIANDGMTDVISKDVAHNAVMNTSAV